MVISSAGDLDFDPVAYFNGSLAAVNITEKAVPLQDISSHIQSILAKTNAQNARFVSSLSQLTDEILRSGSRLAYEVELLRGNANALHESLTDTLLKDLQTFTGVSATIDDSTFSAAGDGQTRGKGENRDPEFIRQLRTLGQVRERLEQVVTVFGEAMLWPLPPTELSITSSLISVSAPDPGPEGKNREEKAKAFAKTVKGEITELLGNNDGGPDLEGATAKVEALRLLSQVWKSTAEERARSRLVDSIAKLIDDKKRQMEARSQTQPRNENAQRSASAAGAASMVSPERGFDDKGNGQAGLFRNLQRLRDEIYLE